jgi:tetratricopeptide (TPR) repeat protein
MLLAWYYLSESNYNSAESTLNEFLKEGGNKTNAYAALAQLNERQNQWGQAARYWREMLQQSPSNNLAYTRLFNALNKSGDKDTGINFLKKLETTHPSEWKPSAALAQLYSRTNNFEEALQHAHVAEKRAPDNRAIKSILANIHYKFGLNLRKEKNFQAAKKQILAATRLYPDNIAYLSELIKAEIDLNNTTEAQKLISQLPNTEEAQGARFYLLALTHIKEKSAPEALAALQKSWELTPNDVNAQAIYNIHNQLGNSADASAFLKVWHLRLPQSAKATLLSGLSAQKNNSSSEAIDWYEKTIVLAPKQVAALNNLAWLYFEGEDPRALATAKNAYENAPSNAAVLDTYGWILFHSGNTQKAQEILKLAVTAAPNNSDISSHLKEVEGSL